MSSLTPCAPTSFNITLPGVEIKAIDTAVVNINSTTLSGVIDPFFRPVVVEDVCNVTVSYTHPGQNDLIRVETWLPTPDTWNGRFQGTGGGGWVAGRDALGDMVFMVPAVADGFSASSTDAGLWEGTDRWPLISEGNVNQVNVHNFGPRSLEEQAFIGKAVTESFYGRKPEYSYFQGCSTGGRQGLQLAQRHPTLYDGIAAHAPAHNMADLMIAGMWPQQVMSMAGEFPFACELDALNLLAIEACDHLDGIKDGILSADAAEECLHKFDPFGFVGQKVPNCTEAGNKEVGISRIAAEVVNATWRGPVSATNPGKHITYGLAPGSDMTGNLYPPEGQIGIAATNCTGGTCTSGLPVSLVTVWYQLLVARDPAFDMSSMTHADFERLSRFGQHEYVALNAEDPDFSAFHEAGGKMVTFHGTIDSIIPHQSSRDYFNAVTATTPNVHDFYRYFEVPGLAHCFGGMASHPDQLFAQLVSWVENGTAPASSRYEVLDRAAKIQKRLACPFPQKPAYDDKCGDTGAEKCWSCSGNLE